MSTFAELSPQLLLLGNALRTGLILGGTSYLQDLLLPMNLSDAWLKPLLGNLDAVKRQGWLVNDVYALQNLMESFLDFKPLTPQLPSIKTPTMILNGEFDFLTPRSLHETSPTVRSSSFPTPTTPSRWKRLRSPQICWPASPRTCSRSVGKATRRSGLLPTSLEAR